MFVFQLLTHKPHVRTKTALYTDTFVSLTGSAEFLSKASALTVSTYVKYLLDVLYFYLYTQNTPNYKFIFGYFLLISSWYWKRRTVCSVWLTSFICHALCYTVVPL